MEAGDKMLHDAGVDGGGPICGECGRAGGAVKVAGTGGGDEGGGAFCAETAADGDLCAATGEGDQMREMVGSAEDVWRAAGGEDAAATGADDVFEGVWQGWGAIEGTMEGDFERRCELDQMAGSLDIDGALGVEDAEGEAADAEGFAVEEIVADELELEIGVDEVAGARP